MANLISYIDQNDSENASKEEIFQRVLKRTFDEEGGYEYRKNRIDQPTNMGIIQGTLNNFKRAHPDLSSSYPNHVKDLTREQAAQIYRKDFFEPYHIGDIKHKPLQETLFDSFVNHSPSGPSNWTREAIHRNTNIKVDENGLLSYRTVAALNSIDDEETVKKINNHILDERLVDLRKRQEKLGNIFKKQTAGIPNRIERFRIK